MGKEDATQERILDFGGFPGRWTITRSAEDTNGEFLEMRFQIESATGDSPFLHVHPHAEESYRVPSGTLDIERFFRRFHGLVVERGIRLPPRRFKSAALLAMLISEHESEGVSVKPPQAVLQVLAFLGRLIGYRLPEWSPRSD